jgi:hypothetical protein
MFAANRKVCLYGICNRETPGISEFTCIKCRRGKLVPNPVKCKDISFFLEHTGELCIIILNRRKEGEKTPIQEKSHPYKHHTRH